MPSLKTEGNEDDIVICLSHVTKTFQTYERPRDFVKEVLTGRPNHKAFKALDDISFDVRRGEIIGVIGRNGAGKSTLLRLIAGVLEPSSGEVKVKGRVSALLELGSGFHPEYTGRENVYLGGMCIGMSREEIDQKMDWIITFSELEEFIDQPFKTYSSGMQARLTFATAISVEPDILIIDEVLAVGDSLFQSKCFQRIRSMAENGCTIFLVSHSILSITALCNAAMLISHGEVIVRGSPREVAEGYELLLNIERGSKRKADAENVKMTKFPNAASFIEAVEVLDKHGADVEIIEYNQTYNINVIVRATCDIEKLSVGIALRRPEGDVVYAKNTKSDALFASLKRDELAQVSFAICNKLADGQYFLKCYLSDERSSLESSMLHMIDHATPILVIGGSDHFGGLVDLNAEISVKKIQ